MVVAFLKSRLGIKNSANFNVEFSKTSTLSFQKLQHCRGPAGGGRRRFRRNSEKAKLVILQASLVILLCTMTVMLTFEFFQNGYMTGAPLVEGGDAGDLVCVCVCMCVCVCVCVCVKDEERLRVKFVYVCM